MAEEYKSHAVKEGFVMYLVVMFLGVGGLLLFTRGGKVPNVHVWIGAGIAVGLAAFEVVVQKVMSKAKEPMLAGKIAANAGLLLGAVAFVLLSKVIGLNVDEALMGLAGVVLLVSGGWLTVHLHVVGIERERNRVLEDREEGDST